MKIWKIILICVVAFVVIASALGFGITWFINHPAAPTIDQTKKHIACIGDSITYGDGVRAHRDTQSYPAVLETLMGEEWQALNYGLNGRTAQNGLADSYAKESFYTMSREAKAEIYIIMLGTNDSKVGIWDETRYEKDLQALVMHYREAAPEAKVYLMQPPKAFPAVGGKVLYDIQNEIISGVQREIIARVAEECGVTVIDLYGITEDHPEWFADGIHPNYEGNTAIAAYIFDCIAE